jgi:hypothetical protein
MGKVAKAKRSRPFRTTNGKDTAAGAATAQLLLLLLLLLLATLLGWSRYFFTPDQPSY